MKRDWEREDKSPEVRQVKKQVGGKQGKRAGADSRSKGKLAGLWGEVIGQFLFCGPGKSYLLPGLHGTKSYPGYTPSIM